MMANENKNIGIDVTCRIKCVGDVLVILPVIDNPVIGNLCKASEINRVGVLMVDGSVGDLGYSDDPELELITLKLVMSESRNYLPRGRR